MRPLRRLFLSLLLVGMGMGASRMGCSFAHSGPLELRGTVSGLPFWLGTTMYGNQWKADVEGSNWWFDREHWNRHFTEMQELGLNAFVLLHPHPFPAFVNLPEYPEAQCLSPKVFARSQEMFHWILSEGKRRGIKIYLLTWNISLPPGIQKKYKLPEFGADTKVSRAYTRAAIAATFREYRDLAGLITMAAESPPGCVDFVEKAICGGLRDSGRNPELIFWSWCSYPEDSRRIQAAWPNTRLMHYLQYEQYFKPMADPRIGRFSRACSNAPMVALGGPKSCHGYLFWGDPEWARLTVMSLIQQNGTGFFIENYHADPAVAREALAYYASYPDQPYDPAYWRRRIGSRYGRPDLGKLLLTTMVHASRIVPRFVVLVHSQTDHYMPQFGLPLVYYAEMPTLTSYVFENVQTLDKKGYLRPNLGLCWPNPDWGERVMSVKDYAKGKHIPGATTPIMIANEIAAHAAVCREGVKQLRAALKPSDGDYVRSLLDLLDLNANLGDHCSAKIRAAIEWEKYLQLASSNVAGSKRAGRTCLDYLRKSVEAWERVVAVTNRIYPGNLTLWRSELASAPPWTQNQIWESYAQVQSHWRENLEPFRRELELVKTEVSRGAAGATLPLWETLRAAPVNLLKPVLTDGFATRDEIHWVWEKGASVAPVKGFLPGGRSAALLDSSGLPGEWHMMLRLQPGSVHLQAGKRYQVSFRYQVVDPGKDYGSPFAVAARSDKGGVPADIGTGRMWGAAKGAIGTRTVTLTPTNYDDYWLFFSIHGSAAVAIGDLVVSEIKE